MKPTHPVFNKNPDYIMIQRRDSLSYIEFIRGKYKLENYAYLKVMFTNMTASERLLLKNSKSFEPLWNTVWFKQHGNSSHNPEFYEAKERFDQLRKGYRLKMGDEILELNMDHFLSITPDKYFETEWGFPKGRRRLKEKDVECAIREFCEETGHTPTDIQIMSYKPMEEVFMGTNNVRYKHVYFVARLNNLLKAAKVDVNNLAQVREVRDVQWFNPGAVVEHIREHNVERKQLFIRVNDLVNKTFLQLQ